MENISVITQEEFESFERRRTEFASSTFRELLEERYEKKCVNCNSEVEIEFHHIVPLVCGGTNNITNIVPLCSACHKSIHFGAHNSQYVGRISGRTGRFTKIPYDKAKVSFDRFFNGEIGAKECMRLLGYVGKTHMADLVVFKKYKEDKKIDEFKNNIDMLLIHNKLKINDKVGYIKYTNGEIKDIYYRPQFIKTGKFEQLEFVL